MRNRILIVGQAKTGTTALYHRIRRSMPKSTRCLFEPVEYRHLPADEHRQVLAKVLIRHVKPARIESFQNFERKILIVRDPRDTLISSILYSAFNAQCYPARAIRHLIDVLERKESSPNRVSLGQVIVAFDGLRRDGQSCMDDFRTSMDLFRMFHQSAESWHRIRYEDLIQGQIEPLQQYLGVSLVCDTEVPECVQRVARTKGSGDWRNWLTQEDIETLQPLLNETMEILGYEVEWSANTHPHIPAEHCSRYVSRLIKERRQRNSISHRVVNKVRRTLAPLRKAA